MLSKAVLQQLAPTGKLRAGINLSNFLLVVQREPEIQGPSICMAQAIAQTLGVPLELVPYDTPSQVAAAATKNEWDIANIGNEPQRAVYIDFSPAYCEIEATYLVHNDEDDNNFRTASTMDVAGHKIAVKQGSAYGLWLENNLKHAASVPIAGPDSAAYKAFAEDPTFHALAGLRPGLIKLQNQQQEQQPEIILPTRILDGQFTAVQQSVGIQKGRPEALQWLTAFVEEQKTSGAVARWITQFQLDGKLSVAPAAEEAAAVL